MAIMKKMLFIINPRSGKEQIRSRLLEILDSFVKAGYGPSVYITQGPKDAEYQAARAKTKELVVCSGGDGTLNEVVSGLMTITPEKRPELGYIPSGSTNDFASSLGLPKNMRKAAQTAALGKPFLVDVGVFGKNRYFVYVAAFGAFTEVSYSTPQETKNPERFRLPVFGAKKKLSGRARGSATHLFMQFADYNACRTADGIEQELERLTREKFLTPEQAQSVEKVRIERLFAAPFGARILQAEKLHREFKFSLLTDAVEFAPAAAGEQVMLQGVVDCFWEEADGIVLVDFKTDRTPDGPQACAARYCAQLNAYAKALTRIYGAPVKEKILYFFSCDCAYHLD